MPASNAFENSVRRARADRPRAPRSGLLSLAAHLAMCPEAQARNAEAFARGEGGFAPDLVPHLARVCAARVAVRRESFPADLFAASDATL